MELETAYNYSKCTHLTLLFYTILYYAIQGSVLELSILAKPHQPNGYDNQIALVDPPEGYKSDAPTTHEHP